MFIGSFNDTLDLDLLSLSGELKGGIMCDNVVRYLQTEQFKIWFWGVIYNKLSDTQEMHLVASLYAQRGVDAFANLDGSFTIIIKQDSQITILRDHHGTNGQVYYNDTHFASSLFLLQQCPDCPTDVNHEMLSSFLTMGYIPTGNSAFKGIVKLGAGMALIAQNTERRVINLFDTSLIVPSSEKCDLNCMSERYGELHSRAIAHRVADSHKVGILLSGGYDSGCNLAALRQNYSGDILSYSVGFKGDNWSELQLAKCMSDTFGTIHNTYEIDGSEILDLPDIVARLGDPFVEGGLMVNYAAMRMVGDSKPDVILGGDGSDQYFGTSAREVALHHLATKYGVKPILKVVHGMLSGEKFDHNNVPYRIRFHLSKILHILDGDMFGFEPFKLKSMLANRAWIENKSGDEIDNRSFEHLYTQHAYRSDLDKIINQVILFKASRMAEMFDNRIAFPYMDLELYRFLQELPVALKCKGESAMKIAKGEFTAKFLLKYHYKAMLPREITERKKQGGFAPMPIFFKDKAMRSRLGDFILNSSVVGEFLDRRAVEKFVKTYDSQATQDNNWFWYRQNKAIQYFNLLTLAIWWEQYVKNNRSVTL